jgi:hypothetical protein
MDALKTKTDVEKSAMENAGAPSVENVSLEEKPTDESPPHMAFPESSARAWSVALGTAGVLFCTFGYANAFGSVLKLSRSI